MGIDGTKKWQRLETYGGKLVENIVQAVARDLLANAIRNMLFGGYLINFHIHDEIIAEVPKGSDLTLEKAIDLMCKGSGVGRRAAVKTQMDLQEISYKKE